jgi:diacylglycerol kinase family enzyme
MRLHTIVNARAGSVIGLDQTQLAGRLRDAFEAAGHQSVIEFAEPVDLSAAVTRAVALAPDVIIVGGGDGTVRSAATILKDSSIALGILPLGTLNRLARDLGIPLAIEQAASALAAGAIRNIDMAELNGRPFLCNSLLGLPPIYSRHRQRQRGLPLGQRLVGYARAVRQILRSRRKLTIALDDGTTRVQRRAISLAVSNNPYADNAGLIPQRPRLDGGELGIYIASHDSGWALAFAFVRAMLGQWRNDPKLDASVAHKIEIHSRKRLLRVSNDGEVEIFETPLRYRTLPGALKVLAPLSDDAAVERVADTHMAPDAGPAKGSGEI